MQVRSKSWLAAICLLALCVDMGMSCLGKKFLLTYPANNEFMFIGMATLYTHHEKVTVMRMDQAKPHDFYVKKPGSTTITLKRHQKANIQLQFNTSMKEKTSELNHVVTLKGDYDFGVSLMLVGHEHSVAATTILPQEYHGTEYYPFFLSHNQIYMALMEKPAINSPGQIEITFFFNDNIMRTVFAPMELILFPYVCSNREKYSLFQNGYVSTAVGYRTSVTYGSMCLLVGNCFIADERYANPANCLPDVERDFVIDMPLATKFAAKEFIAFKGVRNVPMRTYIVVMGLNNGTLVQVHYSNAANTEVTVDKGQTRKIYLNEAYQLITSTKSVQVYLLFTSSCNEEEYGGPSMTSLIPSALFHNRYIWSLPYYMKVTEINFIVVIKRAKQDYQFVYNGDTTYADEWSWKDVMGTKKWLASETEIANFPNAFTLSSSTNRAFGLYLYGMEIAISYLHYVDFMNAAMNGNPKNCTKSGMSVGDLIDNDCDGIPDEESSANSDDDEDGRKGEDVRQPVPNFFNKEPDVSLRTLKAMHQHENQEVGQVWQQAGNAPSVNYALWLSLIGFLIIPSILFIFKIGKKNSEIENRDTGDEHTAEQSETNENEIEFRLSIISHNKIGDKRTVN